MTFLAIVGAFAKLSLNTMGKNGASRGELDRDEGGREPGSEREIGILVTARRRSGGKKFTHSIFLAAPLVFDFITRDLFQFVEQHTDANE